MLWWDLRNVRSWNFATRARAIENLSRSQNPKAAEALASALVDQDTRISNRAASALLDKGEPQHLRCLLDPTAGFLQRSNGRELRLKAATLLAVSGDRDGIAALEGMLDDTDNNVVDSAIKAVIDAGVKSPGITLRLATVGLTATSCERYRTCFGGGLRSPANFC